MSYYAPWRLHYRSKLDHTEGPGLYRNVTRTRVKLPVGDRNNKDWKEVWRSGNLLLDIRGKMVYLVGGYNNYDTKTESWYAMKNPHFHGLTDEAAPLIGWVLSLDKIEYAA